MYNLGMSFPSSINNNGIPFRSYIYNNGMVSECTYRNHIDEAILMITHNIYFYDKIRKFLCYIPKYSVFLNYWENFLGTQKQVRMSHGKRAIRVRDSKV